MDDDEFRPGRLSQRLKGDYLYPMYYLRSWSLICGFNEIPHTQWEDQFEWRGIHLIGKTAIGRTMMRVLNMNCEDQLGPGGGLVACGWRWLGRPSALRGAGAHAEAPSPPWPQSKSVAAGPHAILKQALSRSDGFERSAPVLVRSNVAGPGGVAFSSALECLYCCARGRAHSNTGLFKQALELLAHTT
jgi:hypothetical protein